MFALLAALAMGGPVYDVPTVLPHMSNDMTALATNHLLLQSMFALDAAPITAGFNFKAAPASFELAGGRESPGSLTKRQVVLMVGGGKPTSGFAAFGGLTYAHVLTGGWPEVLEAPGNGDPELYVSGGGGSAVFFLGVAGKGVALEAGVFFNGVAYQSNVLGQFGSGCPYSWGCTEAVRPGAPFEQDQAASDYTVTRRSFLLNLEHQGGHSMAAMFRQRSVGTEATEQRTGLSVLRGLSQPYDLVPRAIGLLGAGFNLYGSDVDYYGDEVAADRQAEASGREAPEWPGKSIFELPLVGDQLAETGALGRVTFQVLPVPLFRLAEAGWADDIELSGRTILQAGARGRVFRRGLRYAPGADAFAGLFLVNKERPGRGWSGYLSYAYNTPDPISFPAVPDAHVLGLQFVYGNPIALPPPVPSMQYPDLVVQR